MLVIDEMGYLPLDDLGATIFFQLVSARYERGSIILSSNKSYGDWGAIFGDPITKTQPVQFEEFRPSTHQVVRDAWQAEQAHLQSLAGQGTE